MKQKQTLLKYNRRLKEFNIQFGIFYR